MGSPGCPELLLLIASADNTRMVLMLDVYKRQCVDNDETAAVITQLVGAEKLILLTSTEGIYRDPSDPSTLIETVVGSSPEDINAKIDKMIRYCNGTSRDGSNGASAKLQFAKEALSMGTTVMIAHARHRLRDIMSGKIPCTVLRVE